MATLQYRDEALVTLTSIDPPSSLPFPDRRILLTKEKPIMDIGRTSKRNVSLGAAKNNAWFDSAVMSREHARLTIDNDKQAVYIHDVDSLHGTFKNGQKLIKGVPSILCNGDKLQFGIPIERGSDRYPPCNIEARVKFGAVSPDDRPKIFRVPDDSDVDDSCSDASSIYDPSVSQSISILHSVNIRPAVADLSSSPHPSPNQSIDLTMDDQYPLSNVREDKFVTQTVPGDFLVHINPRPSIEQMDTQVIAPVEVPVEVPAVVSAEVPVATEVIPVETAPVTIVSAGVVTPAEEVPEVETQIYNTQDWPDGTSDEESDIDLTQSTDMETDSSHDEDEVDDGQDSDDSAYDEEIQEDEYMQNSHIQMDDSDSDVQLEELSVNLSPQLARLEDVESDFVDQDFEEHDEFEEQEDKSELDQSIEDALLENPYNFIADAMLTNSRPSQESPETQETRSTQNSVLADLYHTNNNDSGNTVGKFGYLLNPDITHMPWRSENDSSDSGRVVNPPFRLPSIDEAMRSEKPNYEGLLPMSQQAQQRPQSIDHPVLQPNHHVARELGAKTGKYQYFAARAQNQATIMSLPTPSQRPLSSRYNPLELLVLDAIKERRKNEMAGTPVAPAERLPIEPTASVPAPTASLPAPEFDFMAPTAWTASGDAFLNSAAQINTPVEDSAAADLNEALDDTSAYTLQASKMALRETSANEAKAEAAKAQREAELAEHAKAWEAKIQGVREKEDNMRVKSSTIAESPTAESTTVAESSAEANNSTKAKEIKPVEPTNASNAVTPLTSTPRVEKRKADAISVTRPEENLTQPRPLRRKRGVKYTFDIAKVMEVKESTPVVAPPRKRLRRVAEVVGYAALGGVAVMSALIATAPTL